MDEITSIIQQRGSPVFECDTELHRRSLVRVSGEEVDRPDKELMLVMPSNLEGLFECSDEGLQSGYMEGAFRVENNVLDRDIILDLLHHFIRAEPVST